MCTSQTVKSKKFSNRVNRKIFKDFLNFLPPHYPPPNTIQAKFNSNWTRILKIGNTANNAMWQHCIREDVATMQEWCPKVFRLVQKFKHGAGVVLTVDKIIFYGDFKMHLRIVFMKYHS